MEDLHQRLVTALVQEEKKAERLAGAVRLGFLCLLTVIAGLNLGAVSTVASAMNFSVLAFGYTYSLAVVVILRRHGYHPTIKYVTSLMDVGSVFLLLGLYASIEIPSVALKNYVFLILFPIIALTAFRFDRTLTLVAGGAAVVMYCGLLLSLLLSGSVTLVNAGYDRELFSADVTLIGQTTKIVILTLFVVLVAYQARYTRRVITALVQHELTSRQAKESLDWEMGLASQVQSQLLPHDLPKIPGLACAGAVRQGRAVGGDYYDALEVQDGTLLVVVADVSGKGAPAALIMSEVRAAVHLLAEEFQGLEAFVERLNNLIFRSTDRKTFVTFLAVHIMPHRGEVQYVCAGHVPPMVASSDGVRRLPRGTMPLGVMPTLPEVPTRSMPFRTGDILVCCTDGILEHTDAVGDQFGEDRLAAYLGHHASEDAQTLLDGIFRHVSEFGNGKELEDDATIAVMASVPRG